MALALPLHLLPGAALGPVCLLLYVALGLGTQEARLRPRYRGHGVLRNIQPRVRNPEDCATNNLIRFATWLEARSRHEVLVGGGEVTRHL